VCPTATHENEPGLPVQTLYGPTELKERQRRAMEVYELRDSGAWAAHCWGGTRALDVLKHPVTDEFMKKNTPFWLQREARFWRDTVPEQIRKDTLRLIEKHGWHTRTLYPVPGGPVTERDREAARSVWGHYENGQVNL